MEKRVLSDTTLLAFEDVLRVSSFCDIPVPPVPHYEAKDCILCKTQFGLFKAPKYCSSCGLAFCKDCYASNETDLCPICSSFEEPKAHISHFKTLYNYAKRNKKKCENMYGCQVSAQLLSDLLKAKNHIFHFIAAHVFYKYKEALFNLPFDKNLILNILKHSLQCKCDATAMTLDLFCDMYLRLSHLLQDVMMSFKKIRPLILEKDQMIHRAATRLLLVLISQNKIKADEPEFLSSINTSDSILILYVVASLVISLPQATLTTMHLKNPNVPNLLGYNLLIADICSSYIKSNNITIKYFCSAIFARLSQYKDGVDAVTTLLFNHPTLLQTMIETLKKYLPSGSTNDKDDQFISVMLSETFYQMICYLKKDSEKQKKIMDVLTDTFVQVLTTRVLYQPTSYFCEIQIIFLDLFEFIDMDPTYDSITKGEVISQNVQRLREENEENMKERASQQMIDQNPIEAELDQQLLKEDETIQRLKEEKRRVEQEIENAKSEAESIKQEVSKKMEKINQNIKKAMERNQQKEKKLAQLKEKNNKLHTQKEIATNDIREAEKEIEQSEKDIEQIKSTLDQTQNEISEKKAQIEQLKQKTQELNQQLSQLKRSVSIRKSDSGSSLATILNLNEEYEKLNDTLTEYQTKATKEEEKRKSLLAKILVEKQSTEELKNKASTAKQSSEKLRSQIIEAQMTNKTIMMETNTLNDQLDNLELQLEEKKKEHSELIQKEKSAQNLLQSTQESMSSKSQIYSQELLSKEKELSSVASKVKANVEKSKSDQEKKLNMLLKLWKSTDESLSDLGFAFGTSPNL